MHNYDKFAELMKDKIYNGKRNPGRFYFEVSNENIIDVADHLFNKLGCRLSTATAQESYKGIEVLYHFSHDATGDYYCPRIVIPDKENPVMNSISPVFAGAEWIEKEMGEMFGITFTGHPDPGPLLTGNHPQNIKVPWKFRRING